MLGGRTIALECSGHMLLGQFCGRPLLCWGQVCQTGLSIIGVRIRRVLTNCLVLVPPKEGGILGFYKKSKIRILHRNL
jgi:hypothetical protein